MVGSATPNWSTRFRIVSRPWRTAKSRRRFTSGSVRFASSRPAAGSLAPTAKAGNSAMTARAAANVAGEVSWTWIPVIVRRVTWAPIPFRSRAVRTSAAVRSVTFSIALSTSTPRTRWIPPWRSSPRLIRCLGGYTYQPATTITTATTVMRNHR